MSVAFATSHDHRPRERLLRHGARSLTDAELLAIMLRTGSVGCPALRLGEQLLAKFANLRGLLAANASDLAQVHGVGHAKACQIAAVSELTQRALAENLAQRNTLADPDVVKTYCRALLAHRSVEHCFALYLDVGLRLIACAEIARGSVAGATVYPRELVKAALDHHASAVILTHNHPGGTLTASQADIDLTFRVHQALAIVDVRLLDHIIVAGPNALSLAEHGYIRPTIA
jgi:DNA repair protein RadC